MTTPIFLLSLPRSGSTLLQRVLITHNDIAGHGEPWVLLPLIYSLRKKNGIRAEYSQDASFTYLSDLWSSLDESGGDIDSLIRSFVEQVYSKLASDKKYFLDKTPRYYLILDELIDVFPEGKFIVLYRNPVSVLSSIIASKQMCGNSIAEIHKYLIDLNKGVVALGALPGRLLDKSFILKYEDLVNDPLSSIQNICRYLEIDVKHNMVDGWKDSSYNGRAGDKEGVVKYTTISTDSVSKYSAVISNQFRKQLAVRYINSLDEQLLTNMGYSKEVLLKDLKSLDVNFKPLESLKEYFQYLFARMKYKVKMRILGAEK
ncbi:MAG: sulfotransferase [Gammaproteobacteria bacterium]|nr:sulfotransferase [Gammaproteobacteria bacterium]MCW8840443.1 sulfotransferase [Gammaproteobacteria bacterium]MCW8959139.1 sulfotransferase [Gammaproteobacteria bacterium]MCW8993306.1 sulfotransferase [Gammaproteobacteria bacterium]